MRSSGWWRKRRGCWPIEPEYGAWAWEIHHSTKKDAPSGTLLKLVEEMKKAGYARADRRKLEPRRSASGHARNRLRFRRRYDHAAAHGAQPGRLRARRAESGAVGRRAKKGFTNSAKSFSMIRPIVREVGHVYRMRHRAGHSVPRGSFAG